MDRAQATAANPAARGADDVRALLLGGSEEDRHVENWIVDRLEGISDRRVPRSWRRRLGPGPPVSGSPPAADPTKHPGWKRIRVEQRGEVTVVRLIDTQLLSEAALVELRGELLELAAAGCDRIALSISNVERVSSQFLVLLAELDRHCIGCPGGRLMLCEVGPQVTRILELSGLDRRLQLVPNLDAALNGPWPDRPRRVPVEILGELGRRSDRLDNDQTGPGPIPFDEHDPGRPARLASLRISRGGKGLGTLSVPTGGLRIGRDAPCEVRVRNRAVSRLHAWIGDREGQLVLEDLGSTNGTAMGGRTLRSLAVTINPGSAFEIGPYRFELSDASTSIVEAILSEWSNEFDESKYDVNSVAIPVSDATGSIPSASVSDGSPMRLEQFEGVLVVTPIVSQLDSEATVDAIRDRLERVLERSDPCPRVVLNLAPLIGLSGRAIGLILGHQLRLRRLGGSLRLAQPSASVAMAIEIVGLPTLIEVYPTLDEAVLTQWPE